MPFESEVIPLFIGGVCLVSLLELICGCSILKSQKKAPGLLIAHVVSMGLGMIFLVRILFPSFLGIDPTAAYGDSSPFNSVNLGLFGVCWAFSVLFLLGLLLEKPKND